jgi:hypothetical protein
MMSTDIGTVGLFMFSAFLAGFLLGCAFTGWLASRRG